MDGTTRERSWRDQNFLSRIPSFLASLLMQSSLSPIRRIAPQMAYVLNEPVILPVDSSTSARLIWMLAWSLADRIRLEAEHFRGMYMSTYSPASFCMAWRLLRFPSLVEVNQ